MKVATYETDSAFGFEFTAETLKDAAWIARFQTNVKQEIPRQNAYVNMDGEFLQCIHFPRKQEKTSFIRK